MNHPQQIALNLPNPLAARQSLFLSTNGQPFTTSRAVAERFGKNHRDVLRAIEKLIADCPDAEFHRRNFAPVMYESRQGKGAIQRRPEYRLTHDGFALLAMGFTGRDALAWKIAFLQAFNALEAELHAQTARYAAALDLIRPNLRPVVQDFKDGLSRNDTALWLGKSVNSITYHRRKARQLGLMGGTAYGTRKRSGRSRAEYQRIEREQQQRGAGAMR